MRSKLLLLNILLVFVAVSAFAEPRNALLIANGAYKGSDKLPNPVPEAEMLKKSLIELGFDVQVVTDSGKEKMTQAILKFGAKISKEKGIAFFHYGGHAVQVNGENFLIPTDFHVMIIVNPKTVFLMMMRHPCVL